MPTPNYNESADIVRLAKGLIGPGDLNPGGVLRPESADRLISMIFDDDFLSKVTTRRMKRMTADVDVMDMAGRQLIAVPEGSEPADAETAGVSEHGCTLNALPVQLFPTIKLGWIRDNADNPNMQQEMEAAFAKKFRAEIVDLGFNGTADTQTRGVWTELNKGWVQVALDSVAGATGVQAVAYPRTTGVRNNAWKDDLKSLLDTVPDVYRSEVAFVMNPADADQYAFELAGAVTGSALLAESPLRRFNGHQIIPCRFVPAETVLCTPISNLVFGMHTDIRREKEYRKRKRAVEYTFDMALDYELAVKAACVIGQ